MREEKDIKELLKKFVLNQCSEEEIKEIIAYFRGRSHSRDFPSVEEVVEMIGDIPAMDEESADRIFQRIISVSNQQRMEEPKHLFRSPFFWRYAAAIAVLVTLLAGYIIWENPFSTLDETPYISQFDEGGLLPDEEAITLKRENGQIEVINPDGFRVVTDADGNVIGEQEKGLLTYKENTGLEKLVFNTLTVPYGKRFEVVLSDGTSVHLNAGTSLRYPVKFLDSENTREVFVTGEAFFDVTPDADQPFIVNTGDMDIRVLGTKFNVSTYPEDETTDVVLVEGSVHMQSQGQENGMRSESILEPGEKGQYVKMNHRMSKRKVVTSIYTAWMNGELVFRNMAFEDILKKLERHYNISIENQNKSLAKEKFNASFGDEPVEKVLGNLSTIYGIDFRIEDNQIIVN